MLRITTTHPHSSSHPHTCTHTCTHMYTHRRDSYHFITPVRRGMMGLWRCSFRLGLQWTCRPRWRIAHLSCAVFIVHYHTIFKAKQETCPAHSQWLMQFSTMVDTATCKCNNNKSRYCHMEAYITQRDFPYSDEHNLLSSYNM